MPNIKYHHQHKVGWLRAAVLGANDGIVSTSSLIIGVASANSDNNAILIAGSAGLIAGAISMAAGEYVSVSSQEDSEKADLKLEQDSLENDYELEVIELAEIYEERGLDKVLAMKVSRQLMKHDALAAHARDEIGISEITAAKPIQAALSSAASFTVGAIFPLAVVLLVDSSLLIPTIAILTLGLLAILGAISSYLGGAKLLRGILRISFWGVIAMSVTSLIGFCFSIT